MTLRALAASAARWSPSTLARLPEALRREPTDGVLNTAVRALAQPGEPSPPQTLLDLLFAELAAAWRMGEDPDDEVREEGAGGSWQLSSRWDRLIHEALTVHGAREMTLRRLSTELEEPSRWRTALAEARRWLPDDGARRLLEQASQGEDAERAAWATWALARSGDLEAWRRLVCQELETLATPVSLVGDIARRLADRSVDDRRLHVEVARDPLLDALASDDARRARALTLLGRLQAVHDDPPLRTAAARAADKGIHLPDPVLRLAAVRTLGRLRPDAPELVRAIQDDVEDVRSAAVAALGERATGLLHDGLLEAVGAGDPGAARRLAAAVPSDRSIEIGVELARGLAELGPPLAATALVAMEVLLSGATDDALTGVSEAVLALVREPGGLEVWREYCERTGDTPEGHRIGVRTLVAVARTDDADLLATLAGAAAPAWPEDPNPPWFTAWAEFRRGRIDAARSGFRFLESYPDIDNLQLAEAFHQLGEHEEALRLARLAVARNERSFAGHGSVGWFAYLVGELEESVEATRRAIELRPLEPAAHANLGVALLRKGDPEQAWMAYRHLVAIARRLEPEAAVRALEAALVDVDELPDVPAVSRSVAGRVRELLVEERSRVNADPTAG